MWEYTWFKVSKPDGLGLFRICFFALILLYLFIHGTLPSSAWSDVDLVFWMPIPLFEVFHLPVFSKPILEMLSWLLYASIFLSCIGLLTRCATITALLTSLYMMGLPFNFFGKTDHGEALMVIIIGVLAFSHCGDAWSLDRLLRSVRGRDFDCSQREMNGEYTWPIQRGRVTFTLVFFAAGYSKLKASGLQWIFSDTISNNFILHFYVGPMPVDWGLYIAQVGWLCQLIAAWTIIVETGAPLALVHRHLALFFVPSILLMQIGIAFLMGMFFWGVFICYIIWFPWDRISESVGGLLITSQTESPLTGLPDQRQGC
ncbi:MAG: hypothetical protein VYA69_12395 [Gemmatimonadota bacterium]|nr:hypothetical protein [Gemmatimonadota bacterium]